MPTIRIQPEPFDVTVEIAALTRFRTDIGGIGCFLGIVRDAPTEPALTGMTLEHYPGMTERAIARIVADAESRWDLLGATVIHRVGLLRPADPIVLVLTASAHRQAAISASNFLIDWLKTRAPFWKQEHFADGASRWVEARDADDDAASRWIATAGQ